MHMNNVFSFEKVEFKSNEQTILKFMFVIHNYRSKSEHVRSAKLQLMLDKYHKWNENQLRVQVGFL
jgi:hypothetical protein